jgi:branched-subunit amino acid aminotransferase/4-amino-4-deoxychorismate lyase
MGKTPKVDVFRDVDNTAPSSVSASATLASERLELNGEPVTLEDLRYPALVNYGHFTSMQVDDGRVRGLDLHMQRLEDATRELFAATLDVAAVRAHMRHIVGDERGRFSLRINVFSRRLQLERMAEAARPDVLITLGPARERQTTPMRVKTFRHQRTLAHIKHAGTFELFHHRRLAQQDGYDDALFVDSTGAVSEGSIWNIGFFDGRGVVWPEAHQLRGVSMQLLQTGLQERGIATTTRRIEVAEAGAFRSAFFTNSGCPVRPIASIDGMDLIVDAELFELLEACYASNPLQTI